MFWSVIYTLAFVIVITAATFGAAWLMDLGGGAIISVGGIELTLSPLELAIAFILLVLALLIAIQVLGLIGAVLRFINGDETAISRYFTRNRERRGYEALTDGMMALAAGEGPLALSKAARADRLLDRPELTAVMIAQAAELAGDTKKAEQTYRQMLTDPRTQFVGLRGLLRQKLAEGDTETALKLAQKGFEMRPGHAEVQDILLRLQAESSDWAGARTTLGAKLRSGSLPKDVYRRREAILALSEAKDILSDSSTIDAQEAAIAANKASPDLIPAAVMAARTYIQQANARNATRVLRKAWEALPHPDLAAAFAEIVPEESPTARLKRFEALTKTRAEHPETRMLLAELNIAAENFPAARRALGDLAEKEPTARNLTLMAAIERGSGGDEAMVRGWLTRALTASRGPQWVCDACGEVHQAWQPVCGKCHGFDTLSWKTPPNTGVSMPAGMEMLPMIVGAPKPDDRKTAESPPG